MFLRAELLVLDRAARRCRGAPLRRRDVASATMVGVLMSATLPARLGEPARAMVLARRTGRMRETFPVLLGTLVSQTVLNILALVLLGVVIVTVDRPLPLELRATSSCSASRRCCCWSRSSLAPAARPPIGLGPGRPASPRRSAARCVKVRPGPASSSATRAAAPLAGARPARAPGRSSCSPATRCSRRSGLDGRVGIGGAAAVLFAVNVTAVVPATPSNIGVFQLAIDQRADHRLRRRRRRRARLRRHPAGGRDRDRGRARPARARPRGHHLVRTCACARSQRRPGAPAAAAGATENARADREPR